MDGTDLSFTNRSFCPADLPACRKLHVQGLIGGVLADNDTGLDTDDIDSTYMKAPGNHFWVATLPLPGAVSSGISTNALSDPATGEVVGTIGVRHRDAGVGEIRQLRVAPECRRHGIGSALVEQALGFCQDQHYLKITLDTAVDREPAVRLFEKFGFRYERTRNRGGRDLMYFYLDLYKEGERREKT